VGLRCEGSRQRNDVLVENVVVEGVLSTTKNRLQLIRIVIVKDVFGVKELRARLPTDSIIFVSLEIATTETCAVSSLFAPARDSW